jgi:hypothetical protein
MIERERLQVGMQADGFVESDVVADRSSGRGRKKRFTPLSATRKRTVSDAKSFFRLFRLLQRITLLSKIARSSSRLTGA